MRIGTLTSLALGLLLVSGVAAAEKVKTNQDAELFSRPGESSRVLTRIKEGQAMTVLEREGRWLKVRVKGRTGYVPRSKVDEDRSERVNRNTRRRPFVDGRSTERGFSGGAPEDRIGADAVDVDREDDGDEGERKSADDDDRDRGSDDDDREDRDRGDDDDDDRDDRDRDDDDRDRDREDERPTVKVRSKRVTLYDGPSKTSEEIGEARKGDTFYFMREDGDWVMVENDEGDALWLRSSQVDREDDDGGGGGRPGKRTIVVGAGAGVRLMGQKFMTPSATSTTPDNYTVGFPAATIAVGAELIYPYSRTYSFGGLLHYAGSMAVPGIQYMGATTGVTLHDLDLRGLIGYDLHNKRGMVAYGRLGYHYEVMKIKNVDNFEKNAAMIPSEIFRGPTFGLGLDIPKLTKSLGGRVSLDGIVFATTRSQTENLEDGDSPTTKGAWLTTSLAYRWKKDMTIDGSYELTYMYTKFGDQVPTSMRHPAGAGNSSRRDLNHMVTVGISKSF